MIPGLFKVRFDASGVYYEIDFKPHRAVQGALYRNGFLLKFDSVAAVEKVIGNGRKRELAMARSGWPAHFHEEISEELYAQFANR